MVRRLYIILIILGIIFILALIPAFWLSYPRLAGFFNAGMAAGELEVDFLDIGQGDAELIKTPSGQNILIDGGPNIGIIKRLSERMPFWDRTIDLMILTHPHDDHVSGLIDVIKRYKVKKILYTGVTHTSPAYLAWLEIVRDYHIPLIIIDRPQVINFADDCRLRIIYPLKSFLGQEVDNLNNSSIVARLEYGEINFLFTGDAEAEAEQELLEAYGRGADGNSFLQARVLKVGHHGSDTSSGQKFLKAVKPEIAVISVGKDNKFGHPSLRVIKRLERAGAKVFRTDINGTVVAKSDGQELWVNYDKMPR